METGLRSERRGKAGSGRIAGIASISLPLGARQLAAKLLDENIDPDEVLKGTLEAKTVTVRPALMPITVDWPEEVYTTAEMLWSIVIGDKEFPLSELDLEIVSPSR